MDPNLYAWKSGKVFCQNFKADYRIAVGMIGRAGIAEGTLATREAVQLWKPRYILFPELRGDCLIPSIKLPILD